MTLISDSSQLAAFCERIAKSGFITVDTEFMRERTYWPKLCVIQLAGAEEAAAIDALAEGIDLGPVFGLMDNPQILKVFHAGRQDLEIFHHLTGKLPQPIFDTQIAAMVCGFGDAAGYETLVSKLTRARLDKASRFTDWSARPLTERQIAYALDDVTHLRKVYEKLLKKLSQNGRADWLAEEIGTLTSTETYAPNPEEVFRRIKTRSASPRYLAVLREIAAWRELEAQRLDLPRSHVLRDESLVEIAHHMPTTPTDLARTRGVGRRLAEGPAGAALLAALARGKAVAEKDCPPPVNRPLMPNGLGPVIELLKVLLKMKAEESGAAQKLVASSDDLDLIAAFGEEAAVPAMHGWRREVFGDDALKLCRGEIALAIQGRRLAVIPVKPE
ncbi:MAG: ribonuclease D [Rhodospirillales bacterium]|jgi:ribonuclease D|nr:ribonuclease D [Rhodospirillales bacterium]